MGLARGLVRDRSGNFGIMMSLLSIPLLLAVGFSIDYSAALRARTHMQVLADGAALTLASSPEKTDIKLRAMAEDYVMANLNPMFDEISVDRVLLEGNDITVGLTGKLPTSFMGLANIPTVDIGTSAVAERAVNGSVEVALVLDNTWSMDQSDPKGVKRIVALRNAATTLVNELFSNSEARVRVAVVPYADYVNVGTSNRGASWLSIPADKVTVTPGSCKEIPSETVCTKREPSYVCGTTVTDGIVTPRMCSGACTKEEVRVYEPPKQSCTADKTSTQTWYGCVGSRFKESVRLADGDLSATYPGYIATSRQCPSPILPLTSNKNNILTSIAGMTQNVGSYKPATYIPAGLIWGLNVLSPNAPFSEGEGYDPDNNRKPRKVLVLMTDGDNTLRYNATIGKDSKDGRHVGLERVTATGELTANGILQLAKTNADTRAICANLKSPDRRIEVFSVALSVENAEARSILQDCASTSEHYYDASDADTLAAAFSGIAARLSQVRLKR